MKRCARHFVSLAPCVLALLLSMRPVSICAQSASDGFVAHADGEVTCFALEANGNLLVGGHYYLLGGVPRQNLARLRPDGSLDPLFVPLLDSSVETIAVQPDGRILIGGNFEEAGGPFCEGIARLLPNGNFDPSFVACANNEIDAFALLPDGRIMAGGRFTMMNGLPASRLARLHPDGALDTNFQAHASGNVDALLLQPDGRIVVGGEFTHLNGVPHQGLGRLNADGTLDTNFLSATDGQVTSLAQQADGKILAGGFFSMVNGLSRPYLARLHRDGSLDAAFNAAASDAVMSLAVQPDGKILVGGWFTQLGGAARSRLARLLPDGSLDAAFQPVVTGVHPFFTESVGALFVQPDGKILSGGIFDAVNGLSRTNLARLYADGSVDATLGIGVNAQPSAITPLPDGSMILGGNFQTVGGKTRSRIAKIRPDGSVDDLFISDVAPQSPQDGFVRSVLLQTDGKIVIGGSYAIVAGTAFTNLARVHPDGSADESFSPPRTPRFSGIAIQRDGKILTGFDGGTVGPVFEPLVRRFNTDGSLDTSFNMGLQSHQSYTIALREDGRVLVGGSFYYSDGQNPTRINLALLNTNGTLDASFAIGAHGTVSGVLVVNALLRQPDGSMLVGGRYQRLGNWICNGLGRLRADGSVDTNFLFAGVSGEIVGLALQADGRILVGGSFSYLGAPARSNLLRLNPDGTIDATFDVAVNGMVRGLSISADGKVWIGGSFTAVAEASRTNLARLSTQDAALQSLTMEDQSITWTRTGTSPEVQETSFEQSMDGTNFILIGNGGRIATGWRLDGLSLPVGQNFFIRARGRSISGRYSGSSGLIESVAQFWRLPPPFLDNVQVLGGGQFLFSFTNTNAVAFRVLASTNVAAPVAQWESLGAPVPVGGGVYQFNDPGATNHLRRFYQLRSP